MVVVLNSNFCIATFLLLLLLLNLRRLVKLQV